MGLKTRHPANKRPTTATPRKLRNERMVHQSTAFEVVGKDVTGKPIIREGKGSTYRPKLVERTKQRITEG